MEKQFEIRRNGNNPQTGQPYSVVVAIGYGLEYHGGWMEDEYVTLNVKSAAPVDFKLGDYLVYRGDYFSICYDPNVVKQARRGTYLEGFTYDNVKLYSLSQQWKRAGFKDTVLEDNGVHYTELATFQFFASSVEDLADRLQANLNRAGFYDWQVLTPNRDKSETRCAATDWEQYYDGNDDKGETDVNIEVNGENCWDVLKWCYNKFGLSYMFFGTTVVIGGKAVSASNIFRYGKGNGLTKIERTADDGQELVTKLFAYGSTTNMPRNYYAYQGLTPYVDGEIYLDFDHSKTGVKYFGIFTDIAPYLRGYKRGKTGPYQVKVSAIQGGKEYTAWYGSGSFGYRGFFSMSDDDLKEIQENAAHIPVQDDYIDYYLLRLYISDGADMTQWPREMCLESEDVKEAYADTTKVLLSRAEFSHIPFNELLFGGRDPETYIPYPNSSPDYSFVGWKVTFKVGGYEGFGYMMKDSVYDYLTLWYKITNVDGTPSPHVENGSRFFFTSGIDVNAWPQDYIIYTNVGYPSLLSMGNLMLPGFPVKSLLEYVCDKAGVEYKEDGSIDTTDGDDAEQNRWRALLRNYVFSTDRLDPWIMSKNASEIGIWEGVNMYDGSSLKEIYPSIEGFDEDINTVAIGSEITDNGLLDEEPEKFVIYLKKSLIDWQQVFASRQDGDDMVLSMTSGFCSGRDFTVTRVDGAAVDGVEYWQVKLERKYDNSLDRWFPYFDNSISGYCQIQAGDSFVVTGVPLPSEYVVKASERMLFSAIGSLGKKDHIRYSYVPSISSIYMQEQDDAARLAAGVAVIPQHTERVDGSYHDLLRAGMKLEFEDSDLGIERYGSAAPYIDTITIKEDGDNGIPSYDVVLRDEKEEGVLERLTDSLKDASVQVTKNVVERQVRSLQYVDRGAYNDETTYYCEALNTDENILETSQVWLWGLQWQCLRSYTTEVPGWGAEDWKCISEDATPKVVLQPSGNGTLAEGETELVLLTIKYGEQDITTYFTHKSLTREDDDADFAAKYSDINATISLPYEDCFYKVDPPAGKPITKDAVFLNDKTQFTVTATDEDGHVATETFSLTRTSRKYADKGEWEAEYPYEPEFDHSDDLSERIWPKVWRHGVLWRPTLKTGGKPSLTAIPGYSDEWEIVSGYDWELQFDIPKGTTVPLSDVDAVAPARLWLGTDDVTDEVLERIANGETTMNVKWERISAGADEPTADDALWTPTTDATRLRLLIDHRRNPADQSQPAEGRRLDCGARWEQALRVTFRCTVTLTSTATGQLEAKATGEISVG